MPKDNTLRLNAEFVNDDEGEDYKNIYKRVKSELFKSGISGAVQPLDKAGRPMRPDISEYQLSQLSQTDLLDLLGQYAAFLEYIDARVNEYSLSHDAAERRAKGIKAQVRLKQTGNAADKSDATIVDKRYKKVDRDEYEALCYAETSKAALHGAERTFFAISRAITVLCNENTRVVRENNVGQKRKGEFGAPRV